MKGFPLDVRQAVHTRAEGRCENCWSLVGGLQYHHRRPRGMGSSIRAGTNTAANCLLLCRSCHESVERHRTYARQRGLLVSQWANPAEVPVYRLGQWVVLDDQGGFTPTRKEGA